ncbi:MAG: YihY/virulence factor BrkB family protein [Rubricoccaceae bacterium]|nr:YihY/virulence factor BrkB family protein [Rubricoccaceae bacterium]
MKSTLRGTHFYAHGLVHRLFTRPVPIWCQAIAFKVLVTLAPLILLGTGVFGLVLRQENPFEAVSNYLRSLVPPTQSEPLIRLISELQQASGALTIFAVPFFVFAVVTLFGTLRFVIGKAMRTDTHDSRSRWAGYLFDFRMAVQVGLLFIASFGVTFAMNTLQVHTTTWGTDVGIDPETLRSGWRFAFQTSALLIPWLLSFTMFSQLYYFIPRPRPPLKSVMIGAASTALMFEAAKNLFTYYARYAGGLFRFSQGEEGYALGSVGGVFGLILAFVFWAYLSALMLIIGAVVASLHEERHKPRRSAFRRVWLALRRKRRREETHEHSTEPETTISV